MPDRSIFAGRCKHLLVSEADIIYSGIMGNKLRLNTLSIDIPNCACRINWTCAYHSRSLCVPIKTCDWRTIIWIDVSQNFVFLVRICFFLNFPHSQIFSCCGQNIFPGPFNIWNPHNLSWRKFVFKFIDFLESFIWFLKVQIYNINLIVHWICVVTWDCHLEFVVFPVSKGDRVVLEAWFVGVYLFG